MSKITWHLETRPLDGLTKYPINPRVLKKKEMADLRKSLDKFGLAEPLVIQPDGLIIGGHARYETMLAQGVKSCDCYVPDRPLTEPEVKELNVRLNKNIAGEFDMEILTANFDVPDLIDWGFEPKALGDDDPGRPDEQAPGNYSEQYGVIVICKDEPEQIAVFEQLRGLGLNCRVVAT